MQFTTAYLRKASSRTLPRPPRNVRAFQALWARQVSFAAKGPTSRGDEAVFGVVPSRRPRDAVDHDAGGQCPRDGTVNLTYRARAATVRRERERSFGQPRLLY